MLPDDAPVSYRIVGKPVEAMLTGMRRLSPIDLRNASALGGCIYTRIVLLCQIIKCVFYNAHHISERCEMLIQSLPAASLRTGHRLPAARELLRVSNHLTYMVLWLIGPAPSDLQSSFLPALREAPLSSHG